MEKLLIRSFDERVTTEILITSSVPSLFKLSSSYVLIGE